MLGWLTARRDRRRLAILGVLDEGAPLTGHDIGRATGLGPVVIYPHLRALEDEGLVTAAWRLDRGRRRRYYYSAAGNERLVVRPCDTRFDDFQVVITSDASRQLLAAWLEATGLELSPIPQPEDIDDLPTFGLKPARE